MQLTINRYFKHRFHKNICKSTMLKGNGGHHLYLESVTGDDIIGMAGSQTFMLATALRQDEWQDILEEWAKNNLYLDHTPYKMDTIQAADFVQKCRQQNSLGIRLGQAFINELGSNTPTPNSLIFSTLDDDKALQWLYEHHVETQLTTE